MLLWIIQWNYCRKKIIFSISFGPAGPEQLYIKGRFFSAIPFSGYIIIFSG